MKKRTYIYKSFERFWHWSQALLIIFLILTGLEVHSVFHIFGFDGAVTLHNWAAWAFLVLIVFAIFWHFVTGEWKQYIPTAKYIKEQMNYYIFGIFKGAPHPTKKTVYNKFNPLQRIIYLGLKILVIPVQVLTGIAYMYHMYPDSIWHSTGLNYIAYIHTFGALILIAFVIAHIYLTTTGDTPTESLYAMLTGWELLDIDEDELQNEHLVKAVKNSVAGYYRIDSKGFIIDVNKAWLDMYKCKDKSHYIGKHYAETRNEEDLEVLNSCVKDALEGKTIKGVFVKRKCADGSIGQHILSMKPVYTDGVVTEVEGFIIDIEDAENDVDYMPYIIKNSKAAFYKLDMSGYLQEVNDAWLKLYKYSDRSEVIGKHYSFFRPDDGNEEYKKIFKKVVQGTSISSAKVTRLCKDGTVYEQLVSVDPVYHADEIVGIEGFILDLN